MGYYECVPLKKCAVCGKDYGRRLTNSGCIESWVDYGKRKYCSVTCRANKPLDNIVKTRPNSTVYEKECQYCSKLFSKHMKIVDSRYPVILESTPRFLKRKHCCLACYTDSRKMKLQL